MTVLDQYMAEITKLCETHSVKSLYAFGSVVTPRYSPESDVDLLVKFSEIEFGKYVDNYYHLKFSLEDLFKCKVDLLEEQALKNPYFIENVNRQKQLIYAG